MKDLERIEMLVTVNDDLTEVCLVVKHDKPISEEQFLEAVIQFYQNSFDLDFTATIGDIKECDTDLN